MSTPQLENGYIRIANDLYDATIDSRLSKRELLVLHAVIRKTYGFGKKEDDLTMTQLAHITGLKRSHVGETVAEMHSKNVFLIRDGVHGKIIGIQKDTRAWLLEDTTSKAPSQNGNICSQNGNVPKTGNLCSQNGKSMFPKRDTQKTTPKDNTKGHLPMPTCPPRFDDFWTAYPKKKNKGRAESAFKKIKPEIFDDVMAGLERAKGSKDWAEQDGRFIPHPASWLNARGWEDDLETADENFRGML